MASNSAAHKSTRRYYTAQIETKCGRCTLTITKGSKVARDLTGALQHKDCVLLKVSPLRARARFIQDNPVGRTCEGCGDTITEGEQVVHLMTMPWHRECRIRENTRT